jgi:hypothetical protein
LKLPHPRNLDIAEPRSIKFAVVKLVWAFEGRLGEVELPGPREAEGLCLSDIAGQGIGLGVVDIKVASRRESVPMDDFDVVPIRKRFWVNLDVRHFNDDLVEK